MITYSNFRHKIGRFFSDNRATEAALKGGASNFWQVAYTYRGKYGCELFIKLCCGYSGQGASERLNKQVKQTRSINRNRQSHDVTTALLELKHYYDYEHKTYEVKEQSLICAIKNKLEERQQEALDRLELENMLQEIPPINDNGDEADFNACFGGVEEAEEET